MGIITSCSKLPDPSYELVSGYTFTKIGNNQRAFAGNFLSDSISLQISGQNNTSLTNGMRVEFTILLGGGELTKPGTVIDQNGTATTRWKLGNTGNQQVVKASIYNAKGEFLSSSNFIANAFKSNTWDTVSNQYDVYMMDLVADTVNNLTCMTSGNQLYKQADNYYNWSIINTNFNLNGISSVKMDSHNHLYACNANGDIYTSADKGYRWNICTKPYSGNYYYNTEIYVSNNDYLWVSAPNNKLLCSKNEGYSWQDASSGLVNGEGLGEIYKHPDGTLFLRTSNYKLFKSVDDGKSWLRITKQDRADEMYITPKGDIFVYYYNSKHYLLKSTDIGESFTEIYSAPSNRWASKLNFFNYYKGTYYLLIPGKGIVRTKDFISFEDYWINPNLQNLFIDHNGVFIAKDYNNRIYYRKNV